MTDSSQDKATVLVVDDSRLMRVAARKILKTDFEIVEAEDGEAAWEMLQANVTIDLVMSDLSMPNLDGLGLLKKIREAADERINKLPVIIVTGAEDDDGSKKTALAAGASDFITKPFESVQLLARAQTHARQKRTEQALQASQSSNQKLQESAHIDTLTGLGNRHAFTDALEESLSYAVRHQTDVALLLVQIDRYKVFFLRRGKQNAERLLVEVGGLLSNGRRREDTVARIGLDTFGLVLPSANLEGARSVAENLRARIEEFSFDCAGETASVTASISVTNPSASGTPTAEQLLEEGEQKLKAAQGAGGNCVMHEIAASETDAADAISAPVAEPPRVAEIPELVQALHAIGTGGRPEDTDMDSLMRAIMPLLAVWNGSHNGRYQALVEQLESALCTGNVDEAPDVAISNPSPMRSV